MQRCRAVPTLDADFVLTTNSVCDLTTPFLDWPSDSSSVKMKGLVSCFRWSFPASAGIIRAEVINNGLEATLGFMGFHLVAVSLIAALNSTGYSQACG